MKKNKYGISAIIGTVIALTIVFAIIIPLFLYMQSLQSLFMQEANRRLQYELERLNEKLEVYTTICGGWGTSEIEVCVVIFNPGILSVAVPAIYVESYRYGLVREDANLLIVPGERKTIALEKIAFNPHVDDTIRVKLITLRGNTFISKNILSHRQLPYTLAVVVKNMTVGYRYVVKAEVIGEEGNRYGCISRDIEQVCEVQATHEFIPQTFTDRDGIIVFMVAPGNYTTSYQIYDFDANEVTQIETKQIEIEIFDDIVVRFDVTHSVPPLTPIPLRVYSLLPNNTVIILESGTMTIRIPYMISLGNQSEPLREITIEICPTGTRGLQPGTDVISKKITRIVPGESILDYYEITVTDDAEPQEPEKYGGIIEYQVKILDAKGEYTSIEYSGEDLERSIAQGSIQICRLYQISQDTGDPEQPTLTYYQLVCESPEE